MNLPKNPQRQHNDRPEISRDLAKSIGEGVSSADPVFRKDISFVKGKVYLTMEDKHL